MDRFKQQPFFKSGKVILFDSKTLCSSLQFECHGYLAHERKKLVPDCRVTKNAQYVTVLPSHYGGGNMK